MPHQRALQYKPAAKPPKMKIVYIAHPIAGDVEGNLAHLRKIVRSFNLSPKYATSVPFVPYYMDCVAMDDNVPAERQRGLQNGLAILSRKGMVDELMLTGNRISEGMKQEVFTAFKTGIPVSANDNLFPQLLQLKEEWQNQHQ